MKIPVNKKKAIVEHSRYGKSTVNLLLRFYNLKEG
jgi:ABC-type multidrug transport system fused ATPase/permease subunit